MLLSVKSANKFKKRMRQCYSTQAIFPATRASIPPEFMMHFPSVSDFPLFSKQFQTLWKIFKILPFREKFLDFHLPKFLMTFFSHRPQISNFPPPVSRKLLFTPTLKNFPLYFRKIHLLFTCFMCISFPPYFDHDAFMHHPMHILDAPVHQQNNKLSLNVIFYITYLNISLDRNDLLVPRSRMSTSQQCAFASAGPRL